MLRGRQASCKRLREAYKNFWGKDWPHDDNYLRELTRESITVREVLQLMRECHPFS